MGTFAIRSRLDAPRDRVWSFVTRPEGINHELGPWLRMTVPSSFRALTPDGVRPGEPLFRSWILLLGVLPIDYDDLTLVRIVPGEGFHERSAMATSRVWEHQRWLSDVDPTRCAIEDRLTWEPRVTGTEPLIGAVVERVFRHRHRRLRAKFGGGPLA